MPLKSNNDGTYIANWIPSVSGSYRSLLMAAEYNFFLTIISLHNNIYIPNGNNIYIPRAGVGAQRVAVVLCKLW